MWMLLSCKRKTTDFSGEKSEMLLHTSADPLHTHDTLVMRDNYDAK